MQGFPTLTQERNKTFGFPSLANNVCIMHGWAEQIRVARDLAQSKCQEKPVHRSRLLGVQGIYVIPRPNVHKFPYSPEKQNWENLDCLTWENWAASSGTLQKETLSSLDFRRIPRPPQAALPMEIDYHQFKAAQNDFYRLYSLHSWRYASCWGQAWAPQFWRAPGNILMWLGNATLVSLQFLKS